MKQRQGSKKKVWAKREEHNHNNADVYNNKHAQNREPLGTQRKPYRKSKNSGAKKKEGNRFFLSKKTSPTRQINAKRGVVQVGVLFCLFFGTDNACFCLCSKVDSTACVNM
jgi:hypothetical protein